ncbi:MAG: rRNA maturation RNase YbeY [Candidatus Krumholzibacteriota bacterium]|nr:rRNA maturation RNase YbeY [Candidatus Krumholzibacteriota bacterium]
MRLIVRSDPRHLELTDPDSPWLRHLASLVAGIGPAAAAVELSFVDDATIRRLNRDWRGRAEPTDVLSFHYGSETGGLADADEDPEGEIIVSVDTAARQAAAGGRSVAEELSVLAIHGVHHILGFDHEREADADAMAAAEEPYRERLGAWFRSRSERS